MDNKILEVLSEEIREIKNLTKAVRGEVTEVRKLAEAAWEEVRNSKQEITKSKRKADAAWEVVVMTRNEIARPFWKKWFGLN